MTKTKKTKTDSEYLTRTQADSLVKIHQQYVKKVNALIEKKTGYSKTYLKEMKNDLSKVWNDLSYIL